MALAFSFFFFFYKKFLQVLEQLNVFSDSDVDAATEALNDVSCPLVKMLPKSNNKRNKNHYICIYYYL